MKKIDEVLNGVYQQDGFSRGKAKKEFLQVIDSVVEEVIGEDEENVMNRMFQEEQRQAYKRIREGL